MTMAVKMTVQQAIGRIKEHNEIHSRKERGFAIFITEALNMAVEALEKQNPMKPIIKAEKEIPITHELGRLLQFHCPKCGRFLVAIYESDVKRGGGISQKLKGCSTCLQAIDFNGYYHVDKSDEDVVWEEGESL